MVRTCADDIISPGARRRAACIYTSGRPVGGANKATGVSWTANYRCHTHPLGVSDPSSLPRVALNTFPHTFCVQSVGNDHDQLGLQWRKREGEGENQAIDEMSERKKRKNSAVLAPRCLAALFKSYWSCINTFNCFLWFPGSEVWPFKVKAAFLTLLHSWVYPAKHALGQNVWENSLCLWG